MIVLKSDRELKIMKQAGKIAAHTLEILKKAIRPGITTQELDKIAEEYILSKGARPAFKGYRGFPATICTSINEQVVHGIPGEHRLEEGDIISIDVGVVIDGYYGDTAATFPVGKVSREAEELIEITQNCFFEGIKYARKGNRLTDISHAIQNYVESRGCSVVRDYVGHGIGREMHEPPQIPHFGPPGKGPRLEKGMTLAIEPMVNRGGFKVKTMEDNWTVVTVDGSLSAHYEHTVAITDGEPEILTLP